MKRKGNNYEQKRVRNESYWRGRRTVDWEERGERNGFYGDLRMEDELRSLGGELFLERVDTRHKNEKLIESRSRPKKGSITHGL